ncbi:MAG: glycoside hydrolase family 3 N-terminal domain-containing protein [bacterium]|nr:glycoside hydrolase family 3 N-terminal domain-containing protein [bacterium]
MKELIYQKFILGCQNLDDALKKGLGGVIFFTKDIKTTEQFKDLIKSIKSKSKIPPFLSIDQEGGRVERTENLRPKRESARFAFLKGEDFLKNQAEEISKELVEYGVNLNFAPCIDVNTNPKNPIIGERSFGENPNDVIKGMKIFVKASREFGVIPCVKHFPGHGDADKDSHLTLPEINLSLDEMQKTHLKPFVEAINDNIEMIMVAHLYCKCFDNKHIPASLSQNVIGYLRSVMNYNGVIISDDMVMKGVQAFGSLEACLMAINAGVDMFIFRDSDFETLDMIEKLVKIVENDKILQDKVLKSNKRIMDLKNAIG